MSTDLSPDCATLVGTQEALKVMKRPSLVRCSCSEAIDTSDLSALGRYLQETKTPERRFLRKLADMLDPRASHAPFL